MSIKEEIARAARERGLPETTSPEELQIQHLLQLKERIGLPGTPERPTFRFVPTPVESQTDAITIEVSQPISGLDSALYSIKEEGVDKHKRELRGMLGKMLLTQAMNAQWVDVQINENVATARLTVMKPKGE